MGMVLRSPVFPDLGCIPDRFACEGSAGVSPPLVWWDVPPRSMSFAIFCDDLDATDGRTLRWAICDIPANKREIAEGYPATRATAYTRQGTNDFGLVGYFGGCPKDTVGARHYRFRLFALRRPSLGCAAGASGRLLLSRAMEETLGVAQLVGARLPSAVRFVNVVPISTADPKARAPIDEPRDRAAHS